MQKTLTAPTIPRKFRKAGWICGLALLLGVGLAETNSAHAATIYQLDYIFSWTSASFPTGAVMQLGTVTLTDLGNNVRLDLVNQAGAGSKLDSLYFNFAHGALNPTDLVFSNVGAGAGTYSTLLAATTSTQNNGLKADGDGYFDGKIQYTGSNFLGNGQTLSFELGSAGQDLAESDFNFLSLPGGGTGSFTMASHFQSLDALGASAWVGPQPVPLPAAALLFGSGLVGLLAARGRRLFL